MAPEMWDLSPCHWVGRVMQQILAVNSLRKCVDFLFCVCSPQMVGDLSGVERQEVAIYSDIHITHVKEKALIK